MKNEPNSMSAFTEDELINIIEAIPGNSITGKIMGSVTAMNYVMRKSGVRKENVLALVAQVYDGLADAQINTFKDLDEDYNQVVESVRLKAVKSISPDDPRHSSHTPLSEEDFKNF